MFTSRLHQGCKVSTEKGVLRPKGGMFTLHAEVYLFLWSQQQPSGAPRRWWRQQVYQWMAVLRQRLWPCSVSRVPRQWGSWGMQDPSEDLEGIVPCPQPTTERRWVCHQVGWRLGDSKIIFRAKWSLEKMHRTRRCSSVSSSCEQRTQRGSCCRPWKASRSPVQKRFWDVSQMKNLVGLEHHALDFFP